MSSATAQGTTGPQAPADLVDRLQNTFRSGKTRPRQWRMAQLRQLLKLLDEREKDLIDALEKDFRKPRFEAWLGEVGATRVEVKFLLANLEDWMAPEPAPSPLLFKPADAMVHYEPRGVALIIAPWNYPFQLLFEPLAGAIAAGNCVVLKPSEHTPNTSALIAQLAQDYLDPDAIAVVEGGVEESTALLEQKFDHIFYTGGEKVARIVMTAAAKNLTSVTLELGGKSPCIVDEKVDLTVAARRIAWGRTLNAGQSCVAPDYVLVQRNMEKPLLEALAAAFRKFFGDDPQKSPDLARIINRHHFDRVARLMEGANIFFGGQTDPEDLFIAPTLVTDVKPEDPIMQEEIFAPVLPILPYDNLDEAIRFVNDRPIPLALYVFSKRRKVLDRVVEDTQSGGVVRNDTMVHFVMSGLPFGGQGTSGIGAYHGRFSFETFSHRRGVVTRPTWGDVSIRYPPYHDKNLKWFRLLT